MATNAIYFGWERSIPGRESKSAEHFQDFVGYLTNLQKEGKIQGFDAVFLQPGGSQNGHFLIRGEAARLDAVQHSPAWNEHMVRASLHLSQMRECRAWAGEEVMNQMQIWTKLI